MNANDCVICYLPMIGKVSICQNDHFICLKCYQNLQFQLKPEERLKCPMCRFEQKQNYMVEHISFMAVKLTLYQHRNIFIIGKQQDRSTIFLNTEVYKVGHVRPNAWDINFIFQWHTTQIYQANDGISYISETKRHIFMLDKDNQFFAKLYIMSPAHRNKYINPRDSIKKARQIKFKPLEIL